jgi:CBS domain containing-hemolysin-like protein
MFSGGELAIGAISRDSIERLAENNIRGASITLFMIRNKRRFLLMLLSGRILAISGGTVFLHYLIMQIMNGFSMPYMSNILIGGIVLVLSMITFVFSEGLFAKFISSGDYENRVPRFAYFLIIFHIFLFPITYLLDMVLSVVIEEEIEMAEKEEALIEMVKSESESGVIEQEEKDMIQSIIEFSDTTVKEVMVPRIDMVAAEKNIMIDELIELFKDKGHSRIPVYDARVDNIIGVVYAKDLLTNIAEKGNKGFTITDILRDAYFVPENKKISELLKDIKKNKVHLAIVVDEYGGTAGIAALEDLLEEIVGEIHDEYDIEERDYIWINDQTLLIDAGLDIDDVNEIIRTEIPNEHFDTLGGFIYNQLGFIPEGGEEVHWNGITFKITKIEGNRISKVLVKYDEPRVKDENGNE